MPPAALALLLLFARPASAQVPAVPPRFSAGTSSWAALLGPVYPAASHGFSRAVGSGPSLSGQYLRYLSDWIAVGAEGTFSYFGLKGIPSEDPAARAKGLARTVGIEGLLRVNLRESGAWSPYAMFGTGVHAFTLSVHDGSDAYDPYATLGLPRVYGGLSLSGALGAEAFLFEGFSLGIEGRWRQHRQGLRASRSLESFGLALVLRFWRG